MENQGFSGEATSLALSLSSCSKGVKLFSSYISKQSTRVSTRLVFCLHFSLFRRHFFALLTLRVACGDGFFLEELSLPLIKAIYRSFPFFSFLTYIAGLVALPFKRGVGVVFEDPHLRLMFQLVESGVP